MAELSAQEVLMLELINRARLDPAGEAARYGINLNEGVAPGTISTVSKQPLAWATPLVDAAEAHSQSMINNDYFAHNDPTTGSTPQSRANAAGYGGSVGENIAWRGSTGQIDATAMIFAQHQDLFVDSGVAGRGHRLNILEDDFKQAGVGQVLGLFTTGGTTYNASMVTQDFGIPAAGGQFLTGVTYNDSDSNSFYSVGEGRSGVSVTTSAGINSSGAAGAYSGAIGAGTQLVTFSGGGLPGNVALTATITSGRNAKIDLVGQSTIYTSTSITEASGISTIIGLGNLGLALRGADGADTIVGTSGADNLAGGVGSDTISGASGDDIIDGGSGDDTMAGGAGNDTYAIDSLSDLVTEGANEGADIAIVYVSNYFLNAAVESIYAGLSTGMTIYANDVANVLSGNAGNDTLAGLGGNDSIYGGEGNDVIDGGGGDDTMVGGLGNDTYAVASLGDTIVENPNEGTDIAIVYVTDYVLLNAGVENIYAGLTTGQTIYANDLPNLLSGNTGNDTLAGFGGNDSIYGGNGNDVIDGGSGDDVMNGGAGNDTYAVSSPGDVITESSNAGTDVAIVYVNNYTLAANVENGKVGSTGGMTLSGNATANTLEGNNGADILDGRGGIDILWGAAGNDTFVFRGGEGNQDTLMDFNGAGAGAGDQLQFVGYGTTAQGATLTQVDATHWSINSSDGAIHDVIMLTNGASIHSTDFLFV